MNNFIFAAALLALVILANFDFTNSVPVERTCKQLISDMTKRQMAGIATCSKTMKFKNGKDKAAKMNCVLRCVMINEGVLTAEGLLNMENINRMMIEEVPPSMIATVKPLFEKCVQETAHLIEPQDEFCKSYDPLVKCLMANLGSLCPR